MEGEHMEKLIDVYIIFEESDTKQMTMEQALLLLQCDEIGYEGGYYSFKSHFEIKDDEDYSISITLD